MVREEGGRCGITCTSAPGNYNPITARLYEDLGLFTADPDLAAEVAHLFNYITGFSRDKKYRCMIVAPHEHARPDVAMIEREAAQSTPEQPGPDHHEDEQPRPTRRS